MSTAVRKAPAPLPTTTTATVSLLEATTQGTVPSLAPPAACSRATSGRPTKRVPPITRISIAKPCRCRAIQASRQRPGVAQGPQGRGWPNCSNGTGSSWSTTVVAPGGAGSGASVARP